MTANPKMEHLGIEIRDGDGELIETRYIPDPRRFYIAGYNEEHAGDATYAVSQSRPPPFEQVRGDGQNRAR
jgi:hypothetical protein